MWPSRTQLQPSSGSAMAIVAACLALGCAYPSLRTVTGPDGAPLAHVSCENDQGRCYELAGESCPTGYELFPTPGGRGFNFLLRCQQGSADWLAATPQTEATWAPGFAPPPPPPPPPATPEREALGEPEAARAVQSFEPLATEPSSPSRQVNAMGAPVADATAPINSDGQEPVAVDVGY